MSVKEILLLKKTKLEAEKLNLVLLLAQSENDQEKAEEIREQIKNIEANLLPIVEKIKVLEQNSNHEDNTRGKEVIDESHLDYYIVKKTKKSAEKASIVGDTVGDPMKDTSGPSINILVKLSSIISVVFATLFVKTSWLIK
jgi:hypothetical protein